MPTIAPLSDADWPESIADMKDGFAGALNVYRTMAHHPELLRAWAPLRQHLVKDSALGPDKSEIVILRTALRLGSEYEWVHHVARARAIGLPDHRIAAVREMPDGEDGTIVRAVDAVIDHHRLPPDLEADLEQALGRRAVFDLIAMVGFYGILGTILLTYDVPTDPAIQAAFDADPL